MSLSRNVITVLALASLLSPFTNAHTWIEQYQVIASNGSYIGDYGYSRGYVARTDPTFEGDENVLWMLPELAAREPNGDVRLRINNTDSLCHPNQRTSNYSNPEYPKLKVAPGNYVAMKYYENGHVTLPWNTPGKPEMGGTAFVYGTTNPIPDEKIANVMQWTTDGKGGDGRGFLLTAQNFDDGRCHQINNCVLSAERQVQFPSYVTGTNTSVEVWCETDLKIPTNQQPGSTLTTYWVWQWPTEPGTSCTYPDGKDEYYTTCADFDIIEASNDNVAIATESVTNTLLQQEFQTAAVSTYASRTAVTTSASVTLNNWATYSEQLTHSVPLPSSFSSSCASAWLSAQAAASAGQAAGPPPSCPADKWATGSLFAAISASVLRSASASASSTVPAVSATPTTAATSTSATTSLSAATSTSATTSPSATTPAQTPSSSAVSSASVVAQAAVPTTTVVVSIVTMTRIATITAPLAAPSEDSDAALKLGENGAVEAMAVVASVAQRGVSERAHARQFH